MHYCLEYPFPLWDHTTYIAYYIQHNYSIILKQYLVRRHRCRILHLTHEGWWEELRASFSSGLGHSNAWGANRSQKKRQRNSSFLSRKNTSGGNLILINFLRLFKTWQRHSGKYRTRKKLCILSLFYINLSLVNCAVSLLLQVGLLIK